MTLQMEKDRPSRTAEHILRQPPDSVSYWLIVEKRNNQIEVLTFRTDEEQATLPVLSSEEEAEIFLRFGGVSGGWRARESSAGELISVLSGPCAGVKKVALDPSPEMVVEGTIGLVSLHRESFRNLIMARKGGRLRLGEPEGRTQIAPSRRGCAQRNWVSLLLMGGANALGYRQIPLRAFVFVGVGNEKKRMAAPRYSSFAVNGDVLANGVEIHATSAFGLLEAKSGGEG